jgi:hypothetical protein
MKRMVRCKVFSNIEGKVNIEEPLNNHLGMRNWCNILYPTNAYLKAWHLISTTLSFFFRSKLCICHISPIQPLGF